MKYFLFLLFFTYSGISFSQTDYLTFIDKYEEFAFYAKPNKNNTLSKYFSKRIHSDLLSHYKVNDTIKNKKFVYLTFKINQQNKVTNIIVNSPYSELNKNIREAFINYNIEDLNIPEKNQLNTYTLQILSTEGDKMVINCSTNVVFDKLPVFEGCEPAVNKTKLSNCLLNKISEHVANNISAVEIKKAKILGSLNLHVKFSINEQGQIEKVNCKAPTDSLTKELNRVVALFPKAKIPATRNGNPTSFVYEKTISLEIESENEKYKEEVNQYQENLLNVSDEFLNPNTELALHFKKYISAEELAKIVFPLTHPGLFLYFNIDKNGKPIDIKTNANTLDLNNRFVEIFKKFPFEKLNIKSVNILETYRYPIIIERFNKNIIVSNDRPFVNTPPIFDKDCQTSKNSKELYDCMNQSIKNLVVNNFKRTIRNKTKLKGVINVRFSFQIDDKGKIINVKAFAPNAEICNELEQIIKSIPDVYKPAYLNGKAIITTRKYSFGFNVGNNTIDDFKDLRKTPGPKPHF
ncbi:hypothetical protein [Flavobacterium pectinovorum]|uniref:hypothetical protein n=1 Tax=Flavobacterium pectinovorum TaxID=29533 RepID=UPI001FACCA9C|nr:hypothetical protein [Flavobacterium pectinovorum]MCI9846135.1 hypothetical protein [Flavobacterium pectinovorum]